MSESLSHVAPGRPMFENLPVGLFGSVVGLTGMSVAWSLAHARYGVPKGFALGCALLAVLTFVLVLAGYSIKLVTAFSAVRTEFRHPITGTLFGVALISMVLLPIVIEPLARQLAQGMWILGATGMVVFSWLTVSRWLTDKHLHVHATPPWLIPVVGLLNVPLALPALGLPSAQGVTVFCLAVGLFFTIPLFTLILWRLLFEQPLPDALRPSLLVMLAPFAVGFSTYTIAVGQIDLFAEALYMITLFLLTVLLGQLRTLTRCCPFRVSWWAASFPLAACSVAALRFAAARPSFITDSVAVTLLALVTFVNLALLFRTALGVVKGELRDLST